MKRIVLSLLLALSLVCFARSDAGVIMKAGTAVASYLYTETFDTTPGYDHGECGAATCWTETLNNGIVNEDYTTWKVSGESLYIDEDGTGIPEAVITLAASHDDLYIHFRHYGTKLSAGKLYMMRIRASDDTVLCKFDIDAAERFEITAGGGTLAESSADEYPSTGGTEYYFWIEYQKGTGNNAVCTCYWSTDGTKVDSITSNNGTVTDQANKLRFITEDSSGTYNAFDNLYIDDSAIGAQ